MTTQPFPIGSCWPDHAKNHDLYCTVIEEADSNRQSLDTKKLCDYWIQLYQIL